MVEFYEDIFEQDPTQALEAARTLEGEVLFEETGDELIDKWERELAMGLDPDLTEGMSQENKDQLKKDQDRSKRAREQLKELDDSFIDPKYMSKFEKLPKNPYDNVDPRLLLLGKDK